MAAWSRRQFLQAMAIAGLPACQRLPVFNAEAHVVVVGGGFAGATAAKYIRQLDPAIRVTLIEPKSHYVCCPGSNWLFAGLTKLEQLTLDYQQLGNAYGITLINDSVVDINPVSQSLTLSGLQRIRYDRLVLSPGIALRWDAIRGYDQTASQIFPHAWQAGPQTELLLAQIQAMVDGGTVLICPPVDPYRCPPGPYERASMIAYYLKQYKPRSKILILDPKRNFSKQALFEDGWRKHYGYGTTNSLIEWHSLADNPITELDIANNTLITDFGDKFKGDVLNIIPPQTAGEIALQTGLTDHSGWCAVNPQTSQSLFNPLIHVIGDAAQFAPVPKSAFAANSQAKTCAQAVVALINQQSLPQAHWLNTCYSLVTPEHGISVAGVYKMTANHVVQAVPASGGVSGQTDTATTQLEAKYARAVLQNLIYDSFGESKTNFIQ